MKHDRPVVVIERSLIKTGAIWQEIFCICRARGWTLLDLTFTGNQVPRGMQPTGAFVGLLPDAPFVERLLRTGCHVIRIGTAPHRNDHIVPAVMPDLTASGVLAAEHFAERGFQHMAFVRHQAGGMYSRLHEGFQTKAIELGCKCHAFQWEATPGEAASAAEGVRYRWRLKSFRRWLVSAPKPLGLLTIHDWDACMFGQMCKDAGFEVPSDIGILGIGNVETICETVYPSISSIITDNKAIARAAVSILDQMSSGSKPDETTVLVPPCGLVIRQSTDVFAARTPGVVKAVRFMLDHYAKSISIGEITRASGMSRARLFVAFDKDLGQSPGTILTRIRIDKAKQMLNTTSAKILTIAEACGFGASINMYHNFKTQLGVSPADYRKRSNR